MKDFGFEDAPLFEISKPLRNKLIFKVDEIHIEVGKIKLKLPTFFNLDQIDTLVFEFAEKTHTFKRVVGSNQK